MSAPTFVRHAICLFWQPKKRVMGLRNKQTSAEMTIILAMSYRFCANRLTMNPLRMLPNIPAGTSRRPKQKARRAKTNKISK